MFRTRFCKASARAARGRTQFSRPRPLRFFVLFFFSLSLYSSESKMPIELSRVIKCASVCCVFFLSLAGAASLCGSLLNAEAVVNTLCNLIVYGVISRHCLYISRLKCVCVSASLCKWTHDAHWRDGRVRVFLKYYIRWLRNSWSILIEHKPSRARLGLIETLISSFVSTRTRVSPRGI